MEEALWFSARLRLTRDTSNRVMWAFIYEVRARLEQLEQMFQDCSHPCAG